MVEQSAQTELSTAAMAALEQSRNTEEQMTGNPTGGFLSSGSLGGKSSEEPTTTVEVLATAEILELKAEGIWESFKEGENLNMAETSGFPEREQRYTDDGRPCFSCLTSGETQWERPISTDGVLAGYDSLGPSALTKEDEAGVGELVR